MRGKHGAAADPRRPPQGIEVGPHVAPFGVDHDRGHPAEQVSRNDGLSLGDVKDEMARRVPEPEMLDLCRDLAAEEQSHHDMLSKLRISMDTPPEERPAL